MTHVLWSYNNPKFGSSIYVLSVCCLNLDFILAYSPYFFIKNCWTEKRRVEGRMVPRAGAAEVYLVNVWLVLPLCESNILKYIYHKKRGLHGATLYATLLSTRSHVVIYRAFYWWAIVKDCNSFHATKKIWKTFATLYQTLSLSMPLPSI